MKNVLVIAGKLCIGGAERVCRDIGYYADKEQFRIDYLVFGDEIGAYEIELVSKGCQICHWAVLSWNHLGYYRKLKKMIRENHYDVVHCHTMFNSGIVIRAARHCGVPIRIAHSHSICGLEQRNYVQIIYEKLMRRWIQKNATHFIGCGIEAGNWLFGEAFFQKHGMVILNGIELESFKYDPVSRDKIRAKHHLNDSFIVGHVGHLAPVKNQIFLLQLLPEILKYRPNAHLLLLGEGKDRAVLEREINIRKLSNHVTMTGNVRNVNEYLSAMDVFVFPSRYEGMPLTLVEVQANGLPCVVSDRVPNDVFLTDIITQLPLENSKQCWVDSIVQAHRSDPQRFYNMVQQCGLDIERVLENIYSIYRGEI